MGRTVLSAVPICIFRLDADGDAIGPWLNDRGDGIITAGAGPLHDHSHADADHVLIAPAGEVSLRWLELPDLPPAQLRTIARREIADQMLVSADAVHVAVGRRDALSGETAVAWVATHAMQRWIDAAQTHGIDPDSVLISPAILPRPESGYLRATVLEEPVARGAQAGFVDDDGLLGIIAEDQPVETITLNDASIVAAARAPAIDLRQGDFAKRRPFVLERAAVRRMAILALGIICLLLVTEIVRLVRYELAIAAIDRSNLTAVKTALPGESAITNPEAQLDIRLSALSGGGVGFASTSADLFAALQSVPGIDLQSISFGPDGRLRARISADGADSVAALERAMRDRRLIVDPAELRMEGTRPTGDIVVRGQ